MIDTKLTKRAPIGRRIGTLAGMALLSYLFVPDPAHAQVLRPGTGIPDPPATQSFDALRAVLKVGQSVVVSEVNGRQTKGKVAELTTSSLTVLAPDRRTFVEPAITKIQRTDSSWNGALIGGGIGAAAALLSYTSAYSAGSEGGTAVAAYVGSWLFPVIGAVGGALIDRHMGSPTIYLAPAAGARPSVTLTPMFNSRGAGLSLSVHF